jgi:phage FluMu gp28-like protein
MIEELQHAEIPAVLLPYQIEAIRLSHEHPLFVSEKSRRTGLTYGFAADAVLTAAAAKDGSDVFYIAFNLDMTREFIGYCGDFAKAFDVVAEVGEFTFDDGSKDGVKAFRVDFPSGHAIVALTSKPRSLRGRQGVVIIDEAAFHDELDELLKAALALLMWGGRVIVISTHDGADNPFNLLIEEIRGGKRPGVVQRLTLDEACRQGLYKRICLRTGKDWSIHAEQAWKAALRKTYGDAAAEELDVIPARGSGVYLPRATIEACMSPEFRVERLTLEDGFERRDMEWRRTYIAEWLRDAIAPLIARLFDPHRRSFFGQDFARSSDLSAIALGQIDPSTVLRNQLGLELRNVPFREQKQILDFLVRAMPMWSTGCMDARGNGQQLAEDMATDWGFDRVEAVMATQATYLERMPRMKTRFEDRTILVPQAEPIVEDLRLIKLVKGVPMIVDRVADKADGAKGKRHGDYAIALMNLVAASDQDVQPIDLHALGQERAGGAEFVVTDTGFGTIARRDDFGQGDGW